MALQQFLIGQRCVQILVPKINRPGAHIEADVGIAKEGFPHVVFAKSHHLHGVAARLRDARQQIAIHAVFCLAIIVMPVVVEPQHAGANSCCSQVGPQARARDECKDIRVEDGLLIGEDAVEGNGNAHGAIFGPSAHRSQQGGPTLAREHEVILLRGFENADRYQPYAGQRLLHHQLMMGVIQPFGVGFDRSPLGVL